MEKRRLSWLFGSKAESSPKPENAQEGETVRHLPSQTCYDANLIRKLRDDHAQLLHMFNEINTVSECGGYVALPDLFASFRLALQTHLMVENVQFYTYMQKFFGKDADLLNFINDIKKEMDSIARAVMHFVSTHTTQEIIEENISGFKNELNEIGSILSKRISLEETRLFSLYMPPS